MNDPKNFHEGKISLNQDTSLNLTRIAKKGVSNRIKPKFYKMLKEIMNSHVEPIFNYLEITDLCKIQQANKLFLAVVHDYYPKRLKFEVDSIRLHQERNYENFMNFLKIIDSQIPISNNNWLEFDLNIVISKLKILDKKVITALRGIKSIGKLSEVVFAPFCIILGNNKNSHSLIKNEGWKKMSGKILADEEFLRKLTNLDLDNLSEADMLDAFVYLNLPELQLENIRKYSQDLEKLIIWCRAVLSYHIIIHPFTYRNDKSQIPLGSEMHAFLLIMSKMLERFYKFKKFLIKLNIMSIPLGEYVFNLQHNREKVIEQDNQGKYLTEKHISSILSFLPYNQSHKLISVNKKWKASFALAVDLVVSEIMKEIFYIFLQASQSTLSQKVPILFENNIFSDYFLMIDDILNSDYPPLSKEQLNDIKHIKLESDVVLAVSKVACIILNEKPERKSSATGEIKILYLEKIKSLVLNGQLVKMMKNVNKLDIDTANLNIITEELTPFITLDKLEEIKNINRGLYQLLIWELTVHEFHKTFNPFEFITSEFIINRYEKEEIEMVKYYCDVMNYLKYNLKIKFKFNGNTQTQTANSNKGFEFRKFIEEIKKFLILQKINFEMIFSNSNSSLEYKKISKVYFETKDMVPSAAKPAFSERIFLEVLKVNVKSTKAVKEYGSNDFSNISNIFQPGNLGTIREENSMNNEKEISNLRASARFNHMLTSGNYLKEINKINLLTQLNKNTKKQTTIKFNDIPNELIIKQILFFLDINSLPKFSLVNKKANESVKTHMFIRLYFLNKEKKMIEQENNVLISGIEESRKEFFEDYEILPPNREHAIQMINAMSTDDVMELRQLFKKYNKTYDNIVSPLVLLMGGKAQTTINPDSSKTTTFFYPAQKILNGKEFVKKLRDFELETIPHPRFTLVEKILEGPAFDINKIKQLSPCLNHLLSWVTGVVEFHRVIRKYSLSSYDYEILDEDEISFCVEMDNILVLYYKLLRYANTYCKPYEKNAQSIMASMNINLGK